MPVARIRNCSRCGKPFVPVGAQRICPECVRKADETFVQVQQYLREHPDATVEELATECHVPADIVLGFVREGRLMITAQPDRGGIACPMCGKPLVAGSVCSECRRVIAQLEGIRDSRSETGTRGSGRSPRQDREERRDISTGYVDHKRRDR